MCGIVAVWGRCDAELAGDMLGRIGHRGPDDKGVEAIGPGVLAHSRLSIVDQQTGHQPMFNERGDLAIAFNGEIYNHERLRHALEHRHAFRTRSDTEVLLHMYEEIGEDLLPHLDGMFAFALAGPKGLLLARDPVGIKPLYYGCSGDLILAASELKAFPRMDEIHSLPAGHFVVFASSAFPPGSALPLPKAFVSPTVVMPSLNTPPLQEVQSEVRRRLELAVSKRLMSDVPVGLFLSGGLDSSLIAALMRSQSKELHTFTAGLKDAPDLLAARDVANIMGTVHHELVYTADDVIEALPEVIRHLESFDAPLVRSAVPNYFLARLASRHVKVVLTGEGADELFAGYPYLRKVAATGGLRAELDRITMRLQDTNLQRADRMSMAFGIEARVPFLDLDLLRYVVRLPLEMLTPGPGHPEKSLLRNACRLLLPSRILHRTKLKFSVGAGSSQVVSKRVAGTITRAEFKRDREPVPGHVLRSPEELFYYRIWRRLFDEVIPLDLVGRTADPRAAVEANA